MSKKNKEAQFLNDLKMSGIDGQKPSNDTPILCERFDNGCTSKNLTECGWDCKFYKPILNRNSDNSLKDSKILDKIMNLPNSREALMDISLEELLN